MKREHWFPAGMAVAFGCMVLWNFFFVYTAIQNAPEVSPDYLQSQER